MALITCENLSLGYENKHIVDNLTFCVNSGDYLCIVGENGSGKSTLIRTILKLQAPISGNLSYGDGLKKNMIGYLPQMSRIQKDFPASVEEVVMSGLVSRMSNPFFMGKAQKERAKDQMELMDIYEMRKKPYRALSGGQQQRVLLARAMCATDSILLLDEPVTGLDPQTTGEMYAIIHMLNRRGVAIVTVSHDMRGALRDASHVLVMDHGVSFFGTKADYNVWRRENG